MTPNDLDQFMADPELAQLLEQAKISDDIFDVVKLRENQHSDMLAWCLNPNEGHSQGDAVVKDFLVAAWEESASAAYANKRFFEVWRPAKIRTTSFGSAFLTRELGVHINGEGSKGRLDLFLVDPLNKLVVTIENKAGRKLSDTQLKNYWDAVRRQVMARPAFKEYEFAFVFIDRELDEQTDRTKAGRKWIVLDYSWLKASADRARQHIARANQSAQLMMAYCQRQTDDWQSDDERRLVDTAASLAARHERVVTRLKHLRRTRITSWTPALMAGFDGDLLRFFHQNEHACDSLVEGSGIAAVAVKLKRKRPELAANHIDVFRRWLALASNVSDELMKEDANPEWPVYVTIRRETSEDSDEPRFQVRLIWIRSAFAPYLDEDAIRSCLESDYPELAKRKARNVRRVKIGGVVSAGAAVEKALEVSDRLELLLRACPAAQGV